MTKPIAWLEPEWGEKICPEVGYEVTMTDDHPKDLCWIPLYSHPPQNTAQAYLKGFDEGCKSMSARNKAKNIGCLGMPVNVPVTPPYKELKAINDTQAETINALTARIVALETK